MIIMQGVVAPIFNPSTRESEADRILRDGGQTGLYSKFQDNQYLKRNRKKERMK